VVFILKSQSSIEALYRTRTRALTFENLHGMSLPDGIDGHGLHVGAVGEGGEGERGGKWRSDERERNFQSVDASIQGAGLRLMNN